MERAAIKAELLTNVRCCPRAEEEPRRYVSSTGLGMRLKINSRIAILMTHLIGTPICAA